MLRLANPRIISKASRRIAQNGQKLEVQGLFDRFVSFWGTILHIFLLKLYGILTYNIRTFLKLLLDKT